MTQEEYDRHLRIVALENARRISAAEIEIAELRVREHRARAETAELERDHYRRAVAAVGLPEIKKWSDS